MDPQKKGIPFAIHMAPTFKIDYRFNPPDDEKEEDLVHSVFTHIEPENHYKVGDPFPILYRIYNNIDNLEVVDSMPFPLPLGDIFYEGNAFYHLTELRRRHQFYRENHISERLDLEDAKLYVAQLKAAKQEDKKAVVGRPPASDLPPIRVSTKLTDAFRYVNNN